LNNMPMNWEKIIMNSCFT